MIATFATLLSTAATLLSTVATLLSTVATLVATVATLLSTVATLLSTVATLLATMLLWLLQFYFGCFSVILVATVARREMAGLIVDQIGRLLSWAEVLIGKHGPSKKKLLIQSCSLVYFLRGTFAYGQNRFEHVTVAPIQHDRARRAHSVPAVRHVSPRPSTTSRQQHSSPTKGRSIQFCLKPLHWQRCTQGALKEEENQCNNTEHTACIVRPFSFQFAAD